jgi:hypothetical protein
MGVGVGVGTDVGTGVNVGVGVAGDPEHPATIIEKMMMPTNGTTLLKPTVIFESKTITKT